jgi:hypothetical protein
MIFDAPIRSVSSVSSVSFAPPMKAAGAGKPAWDRKARRHGR